MAAVDRIRTLFEHFAGAQAKPPTIVDFPPERVLGTADRLPEMRPRLDYFEVVVNELYLSAGRKWFRTYSDLLQTPGLPLLADTSIASRLRSAVRPRFPDTQVLATDELPSTIDIQTQDTVLLR